MVFELFIELLTHLQAHVLVLVVLRKGLVDLVVCPVQLILIGGGVAVGAAEALGFGPKNESFVSMFEC